MNTRPQLVLIAAVTDNNVIGRGNALPWRLKHDMQHFRATTSGHCVLMGRNTWDSLGKALPGRRNIVISRNTGTCFNDAEVYASPDAALTALADVPLIFVIGGAQIYRALLPQADTLLLTHVHVTLDDGDVFFPQFDPARYTRKTLAEFAADVENDYPCTVIEYHRK